MRIAGKGLIDRSQILPKEVAGVKADPPTIFFSQKPALLVNLDGEPIWSPIEGLDLRFALNTNWDLFQHTSTKTYYLRNEGSWLKATDLKGAWAAAGTRSLVALETVATFARWTCSAVTKVRAPRPSTSPASRRSTARPKRPA